MLPSSPFSSDYSLLPLAFLSVSSAPRASHAYVLAIWLTLRLWKALDAHSGYMLPFPLSIWHQWPGALSAELHDYHHEINQGCYGASSLFWDRLCGTDSAYNAMKTKAAAADTPAASSPATRSRISRKKY